jgi:DNA-binding response OmpR family regulator
VRWPEALVNRTCTPSPADSVKPTFGVAFTICGVEPTHRIAAEPPMPVARTTPLMRGAAPPEEPFAVGVDAVGLSSSPPRRPAEPPALSSCPRPLGAACPEGMAAAEWPGLVAPAGRRTVSAATAEPSPLAVICACAGGCAGNTAVRTTETADQEAVVAATTAATQPVVTSIPVRTRTIVVPIPGGRAKPALNMRVAPVTWARRRRRVEPVSSVVLIEDDAGIRLALERALIRRGHQVRSATDAMTGLAAVVDASPDVVVLDLGLPDVDGVRVLGMVRQVSSVPVIIATARDDEREMIRVLDRGADDYVVKPFSAEQLDARIRAVLRRSRSDEPERILTIGALTVDREAREAALDGQPLDLTRMEFDLLSYLAARTGRVVSKRQLMAEVWRQPYGGADKTVDVHLSWLRRKLGESAAEPRYLLSVRGVGVKLVDPTE